MKKSVVIVSAIVASGVLIALLPKAEPEESNLITQTVKRTPASTSLAMKVKRMKGSRKLGSAMVRIEQGSQIQIEGQAKEDILNLRAYTEMYSTGTEKTMLVNGPEQKAVFDEIQQLNADIAADWQKYDAAQGEDADRIVSTEIEPKATQLRGKIGHLMALQSQ